MKRPVRRHGRGPAARRALVASLRREDPRLPFGPAFFLLRLGAFVRDRCPTPADGLPVVILHLADGEALDVCHVMGLAKSWVALAVHDVRGAPGPPRMRTEVVPYGAITRVTLRAEAADGVRIGYEQAREPITLLVARTSAVRAPTAGAPCPEAAFAAAAGAPRTGGSPTAHGTGATPVGAP